MYKFDFLLLAKDGMVLYGTIEKLTGSGRYYGMEKKVGKNKNSDNQKANVSSTDYDR
jgi:hypothetical protein